MRPAPRSFLVLGAAVLLFFSGCVGNGSDRLNAAASALHSAPLFALKDLGGAEVSLETLLKGKKAVLVNFWATWCPPCREEIPDLIALQKRNQDKGFTVLGVDVGESAAKAGSFAKKMGINYPILLDSGMEVAERYTIVGIPTSFLIASDGKVLGEYHSYDERLGRDIEKALKQ